METINFNWLEERIFYRKLSEDEKTDVSNLIQIHRFASGESIEIEIHGATGHIYMIHSGTVKLHFELENDITHTAEMSEGAQIGDLAFLEKDSHIVMNIMEDVIAYKISRAALANMLIFNIGTDLRELWPKQKEAIHLTDSKQPAIAAGA